MKNFVDDLLDVFKSPVVCHGHAWADMIPDWLRKAIIIERLVYLKQNKEFATDAELVAYLMTASFEGPIGGEWTDIFTYFAKQVCQRHKNNDVDFSGIAPESISDYERNYLAGDLRVKIYNSRRKHLKEILKTEKKEKIHIPKEEIQEYEREAEAIQLQLF